MLSTNMFIVGAVIFLLYISGLLYMIKWANKTQDQDMIADKNDNTKKNQQSYQFITTNFLGIHPLSISGFPFQNDSFCQNY